jgi:transposase-like protein
MAAVEAEMAGFMARYQDVKLKDGRQAVVRNGYLPERDLMTGLGRVKVRVPKSRDRSAEGIRFSSSLIPPYLKRSHNLEDLLPVLYLKASPGGTFKKPWKRCWAREPKVYPLPASAA